MAPKLTTTVAAALILTSVLAPTLLALPASAPASTSLGATWTKRTPPSPPPQREGHGQAFSEALDRVLVFGGCNGGKLGDTWTYDIGNDSWSNITPSPSPPKRYVPGMAYDTDLDLAVVYGGNDGIRFNDTWVYDNTQAKWLNRTNSSSPPRLDGQAMAYDPGARRVVMFGGQGDVGIRNHTWLYDVQNNTWTNVTKAKAPPIRRYAALAYDPPTGRMILFGGDGPGGQLGDTWAFDTANTNWTELTPAGSPTARTSVSLAYHESVGRLVMFSGYNGANPADTWVYNGTANVWGEVTPPGSPSWRFGHGLSYDRNSDLLMMFGGTGAGQEFLNETWVLQLTLPLDEVPPGSAGLVLTLATATAVLTGAFAAGTGRATFKARRL